MEFKITEVIIMNLEIFDENLMIFGKVIKMDRLK
jgi:hypothetical protein